MDHLSIVDNPVARLASHGRNLSPSVLDSLSEQELKDAIIELQNEREALIKESVEFRDSFERECEANDRYYDALFIEHFRVKRLMQALRDVHGRKVAERIYHETAPEIQKEVLNFQQNNQEHPPLYREILEEFKGLLEAGNK